MKLYKNRFSLISSSKVDRFTSNQDQNNRRPILNIQSYIFHQRKLRFFV